MTTAVKRAPKARSTQKTDLAPQQIAHLIGMRVAGGIYLGRFFIEDRAYALIGAPRKEGELADQQYHAEYVDIAGATSLFDGFANTEAMAAAGSELAKKIRALRIGGADDWYLLSRGEGLVAQAANLTGPEAFPKKWHWTSTQHPGARDSAWLQDFSGGDQDYDHKDGRYFARAVRRVPIQSL